MKTPAPSWGSIARLAFTIAWSLGVVITALAFMTVWSEPTDWRFVSIAIVLAVPAGLAVLGGSILRTNNLGYDERRRQSRQRVKDRRPACVLIGSIFLAVAIVTAIVAIWLEAGHVGATSAVFAALAAWSAGMSVDWD